MGAETPDSNDRALFVSGVVREVAHQAWDVLATTRSTASPAWTSTGKPVQEDVTSRAYLDLTDLRWLHPEVEAIGAWIEQKGAVAAGRNVVPLVRPA